MKKKVFSYFRQNFLCNVQENCNNDSAFFTDKEGMRKSVKENLNEFLEMIFNHIEESAKGSESESIFEGLFDDFDVNNNKLGSTVAK